MTEEDCMDLDVVVPLVPSHRERKEYVSRDLFRQAEADRDAYAAVAKIGLDWDDARVNANRVIARGDAPRRVSDALGRKQKAWRAYRRAFDALTPEQKERIT